MGLCECGVILDGFWIKYYDVSEVAFFNHATSLNFEIGSRERCHSSDGFRQGDDFFLSHIFAQ